jgi:hypothetical protein
MKSKRATKGTTTRIFRIAPATKANTHDFPIINFARQLTHAAGSVIPVPLTSSVICVVTQSRELARPDADEA